MKFRIDMLHRLGPWLSVFLFGLALWLIHDELADYNLADIRSVLQHIPPLTLWLAVVLTMGSYIMLVAQDRLALYNIGQTLPLRKVAFTSLISYAISNNVGHALFSGGSLRLRFYTAWGVQPVGVASIALFCGFTYFIGLSAVLLCSVPWLPHEYFTNPHWTTPLHTGIILAALFQATFWCLVLWRDEPLQFKSISIPLPSPNVALLQVLCAALDLILAACVLYAVLNVSHPLPFALFINAYLLSQVIGLFSQVPGGLGVFEGVFMFLLGSQYAGHKLLVGLLLYRVIYYFMPLFFAGIGLVCYEARRSAWWKHPATKIPLSLFSNSLPQVFSVLILMAGTVLLLSGTTPAIGNRLIAVGDTVGLPAVELSHMVGSIVGLLLLILANAVRQRIDAAWHVTVLLLLAGIAASLIKGLDYEEAGILFGLLVLFLPHHRLFYRKSPLLSTSMSPSWLAIILAIVGATVWLGFFSYKHVEYSHELWWRFSLKSEASRFLRTTFMLVVLVTGLLVNRLLNGRGQHAPVMPNAQQLQQAAAVIAQSDDAQHCVALVGDKALMWSDDHRAFIAFSVTPRFWVAIGDPCGAPDACENVVWKFREEADRYGAGIAFYHVSPNTLPLYIDMGLSLIKLGEEALVDLTAFSLEGKKRNFLRQRCAQFERDDYEFVIYEHEQVPAIIPQLRWISDDWLKNKGAREKAFSLGFFSADYITRTRVAAVRKNDQIVAFANLWEVDSKHELSLDMMRYHHNARAGAMEFLFARMMLWGKEQGYHWFSLGMAPLAGLENHRLAPRWHKLGNVVFRFGNDFYNFEGLHFYKNKFEPVWRPRYFAAPAGLATANALMQVTRLINRGYRAPRDGSE